MNELTDDQVKALLDEMTREVICGELDKALAERIGRALLATRTELAQARADADAAVALAHKNMAARIGVFEASARDRGDVPREAAFCLCVDEIRALAPVDGLAMVQELRAERDAAELHAKTAWALLKVANDNTAGALADRDILATENASLKARVDGLVEALVDIAKQKRTDPGDGWTWHERLGWIGPDGKPADPRRRG